MGEPTVFYLGKNAKLYRGDAGSAIGDLTELAIVKDVTVTLGADKADDTGRDNGGWRATVATLRVCSIEFEMKNRPSNPGYQAIRSAYLTGGQVCLAALTGAVGGEGVEGPHADFTITGFNRKEPQDGPVTYDVTAEMATFIAWIGL